MRNVPNLTLAAMLTIIISMGIAFAHSGASGIIKKRMDIMSDVGDNMKAIAAMMKGEVEFDGMAVKSAARKIAQHADRFPDLFPQGSGEKPSEALPAIWQDWEGFTKLGAELKTAANDLAKVADTANSPPDIVNALQSVGTTCKSCHQKYRIAK